MSYNNSKIVNISSLHPHINKLSYLRINSTQPALQYHRITTANIFQNVTLIISSSEIHFTLRNSNSTRLYLHTSSALACSLPWLTACSLQHQDLILSPVKAYIVLNFLFLNVLQTVQLYHYHRSDLVVRPSQQQYELTKHLI